MRTTIYRDEAREMDDAHAEFHVPPDGTPRDGCPSCDRRELSSYPERPLPDGSEGKDANQARSTALSEFESACNTVALVFDKDSDQRRVALQARSAMRVANGEAPS